MIRVRFTTSEFNLETREWVELPIADLIADREEVRISGPRAEWISLDIAVIDPENRERVTRSDGAERWAPQPLLKELQAKAKSRGLWNLFHHGAGGQGQQCDTCSG